MRLQLIIVMLLAVVAFWSASTRAAQERPLTESDLLKLLAGGVYNSRVAMLVHERGITFLPTKRYLRLLAHAGADRALQRTVMSARRVTLRAELSPGDFRGGPPISQQAGSEHTDTSLHQVFNFRSNTASSRDLGMRAASQSNIPAANEPTPRTEAQASFVPRSHADDVQNIMQAWLARTSNQQLIPVGTTITTQNWRDSPARWTDEDR